jgi:Ca2+-binding EF-hand superfamily protein
MITNILFSQSQNRTDRPNRPSFEQLLKNMDSNEDGKLSKSELKGPLNNQFEKADTDEDGFVTKEEFENFPRPKRKGKMGKRNSDNPFARVNDRQKRPSFEQVANGIDTNKDGKISKTEAKGPLSNHFVKVDADNDGFITKTEFENIPQSGRPSFEQVLNNLDTNKDGKISKTEAKKPLSNNFTKVDKDEDGFITKTEFENMPSPKQRNRKMGKRNSEASSKRGNNRQDRPSFEQVLNNLDTNKDGKISKSEAKERLSNHFAKVDTDNDGFISKAEFDNMPQPERPSFDKVLSDLDTNKDGKISKPEAKGPLSKNFTKVDTDEDGFISKTEFENIPSPKRRKGRR